MSAPLPIDEREQAALKLYVGLMEEAKVRFYVIDMAIGGRTGLPERGVREFCYLQLRMLCEVIALACLTANGNIKETQELNLMKGAYADKIIKRLAKLHPEFYPRPAIDTRTPSGGIHLVPITDPFLTKDDIIRLYHQCGDNLHRGSLKRILEPQTPVPAQYGDIIEWTNKVIKLLDKHYITLSDKWTTILCLLGEPYPKGVVQIALARPPERE
jgi:hypothetical protein